MKTKIRPSTPKAKIEKDQDETPIKFSTPSTKPNLRSSGKSMAILSHSPAFQSKLSFLSKQHSKSPQKTPKVDLQKLFQQNPNLFLKEDLGKNIDNVLSRAYDNVLSKKNEKEDLEIKQEILLKEIKCIEKEILPLIFKKKEQIQFLEHEKSLHQQYEGSLRCLQEKIFKKKDEIQEKEEIMNEKIGNLNSKVKDLTQENMKIANEIKSRRTLQKDKIEQLRKEFEESKLALKIAENHEEEMKKKYEEMKNNHLIRIDKLKNKERAFLGILKH